MHVFLICKHGKPHDPRLALRFLTCTYMVNRNEFEVWLEYSTMGKGLLASIQTRRLFYK